MAKIIREQEVKQMEKNTRDKAALSISIVSLVISVIAFMIRLFVILNQ